MKTLESKLFTKASKTPCKFKVAVVCYDKRSKLLGTTYNLPRFCRLGGSIHAEMRALQKWGTSIKSMTLLRFGKSGELRPIHPCVNCNKVLAKLKIRIR